MGVLVDCFHSVYPYGNKYLVFNACDGLREYFKQHDVPFEDRETVYLVNYALLEPLGELDPLLLDRVTGFMDELKNRSVKREKAIVSSMQTVSGETLLGILRAVDELEADRLSSESIPVTYYVRPGTYRKFNNTLGKLGLAGKGSIIIELLILEFIHKTEDIGGKE